MARLALPCVLNGRAFRRWTSLAVLAAPPVGAAQRPWRHASRCTAAAWVEADGTIGF